MMSEFFKNRSIWVWLLAVLFFFIYAWPYWSLRPAAVGSDMWIFNTPDETANYFFSASLAEGQGLKLFEPLNQVSGELNLVHPRSTTVVDNSIEPGGFLGFVLLAGYLGGCFGAGLIPWLTPLLSVFGAAAFYFLIKKIWGEKNAWWSFLSLLIMPAWWYYNSRSLFNNIAALDLWLIGFYWLFSFGQNQSGRWLRLLLAGGFLGLATALRPVDALWIGPAVLALIIFQRPKNRFAALAVLVAVMALVFIPVLWWQKILYGSYWSLGYAPSLASATAGGWSQSWSLLRSVFPVDFSLKNILYNLYFYYGRMFWWYFCPAAVGGLLLIVAGLKKQAAAKEIFYFWLTAVVSAIIFLYYGSWFFFNNLQAKALIGSSQVRYFLPVYVLALPVAIYSFDRLFSFLSSRRWRAVLAVVLLLFAGYWSVQTVWFRGDESLSAVSRTVRNYQQINQRVRALTEEQAVVVTSYNDKVFFPRRRVIFYWQEPRFLANIEIISQAAPIYFYSIDRGREMSYVEGNSNLRAELVEQLNEREYLYRLTVNN